MFDEMARNRYQWTKITQTTLCEGESLFVVLLTELQSGGYTPIQCFTIISTNGEFGYIVVICVNVSYLCYNLVPMVLSPSASRK